MGLARAGRGYPVSVAPRGHRLPRLPAPEAPRPVSPRAAGKASQVLGGENCPALRPENRAAPGGSGQAPPPPRLFRSRRGGVCAAAGTRWDKATLSRAFLAPGSWSPTGAASGSRPPGVAVGLRGAEVPPRHSAGPRGPTTPGSNARARLGSGPGRRRPPSAGLASPRRPEAANGREEP